MQSPLTGAVVGAAGAVAQMADVPGIGMRHRRWRGEDDEEAGKQDSGHAATLHLLRWATTRSSLPLRDTRLEYCVE